MYLIDIIHTLAGVDRGNLRDFTRADSQQSGHLIPNDNQNDAFR